MLIILVGIRMLSPFFLIYVLVGLICGFVDSALGMGYGVSSASVLVSFGINPAVASASVHTSEGFVDAVSAISHLKLKNFEGGWKWFLSLIIPAIAGSVLGAGFLCWLSLKFAKPFVSVVLLMLGMMILSRFVRKKTMNKKIRIPNKLIPLLGFIASFIDISGGGGWGPILTPILVLGGKEPRKAIGLVEISEPIVSFVGVLTFGFLMGFENFLWAFVLPMMLGGFILTPIAAWTSKKVPKRLLGLLIGGWLIILNLRTLILSLI